jgi:hypothetical protein
VGVADLVEAALQGAAELEELGRHGWTSAVLDEVGE